MPETPTQRRAVDVDRPSRHIAARVAEGQSVDIGDRGGSHFEGTFPPRAQLTNVGGVEQLHGPVQHLVTHLPVEYCVDRASVERPTAEPSAPPALPRVASAARVVPETRPQCDR